LLNRESPTILTSIAITGVVTTTALGIKATPKAIYEIEEENSIRLRQDYEPLRGLEIIKLVGKYYIPTAISGGITIGAIVGAHSIFSRRNAALLALFTLTETALKEYQDKVVEMIGERKEEKIRDSLAQDKLDNHPIERSEIYISGIGQSLFFDALSGRYFMSDFESVRTAVNDFNALLFGEGYQTLNEWYEMLNLEPTEMGKSVGWEANTAILALRYSPKIATNKQPCIVIDYKNSPKNL